MNARIAELEAENAALKAELARSKNDLEDMRLDREEEELKLTIWHKTNDAAKYEMMEKLVAENRKLYAKLAAYEP